MFYITCENCSNEIFKIFQIIINSCLSRGGNWLYRCSCALTPLQIQQIRASLFDSKPQEEILPVGDAFVDGNDLSTLAAERYLTGFVIDAACLKYCEEVMSKNSQPLHLPSFTQTWASRSNPLFLQFCINKSSVAFLSRKLIACC